MRISEDTRSGRDGNRAVVRRISSEKRGQRRGDVSASSTSTATNDDYRQEEEKHNIAISSSIVDERSDACYSGMLSMFGSSTCEEGRFEKTVGLDICGMKGLANDAGANESQAGSRYDIETNNDEIREGVERTNSNDSEDVTLGALGKGMGDDLKSLPSLQDTFIADDEGSVLTLDNESIPSVKKDSKAASSKASPNGGSASGRTSSNKNESVESAVEKKINNLKSERTPRDLPVKDQEKTTPSLMRKMFPKTSGRTEEDSEISDGSHTKDSVLESRRQLLVMELRQAVNKYGRFDVRCANITAALGDLYEENREYKQALKLHKDTVSLYSIKLGDDHQTTLNAKLRLGQVQQNAGDYDASISTFFQVMSMTKALKGEKEPAAADILVRVAAVLRKKGKYEPAIKTLKRALKTYREVLGDSHPSVSSTVDAIASLYVTVGDFTKASAILEEVVKLKAATMGMSSNDVAASLSELATCYECAEQYSKAMKNLKKAYKIYAEVGGESGERAILTLERIALIYQATGQYKKAAISYLGVLRGRKRALGDSHPTVADTYFHLGVSLRESGQREKAFKCMKQALNIYVGEGKDMHDVEMIAEVMHELAIIHKANDNMHDAIKTFKQEVAVRRKLGQPEFPLIAQTLNHLGVSEFEIKNHNRALNYFMEALTIYEKRGSDLGTDFAEVLYNTGLVFEAIRNKQRAYDAFLEAARIFKENGYGEDHPHLSKAANKLRKLGYSCQCRSRKCSTVPCETLLGHRGKEV
jgi:tetratricopeptide (TPR) repeat protein